MAAATREPAAEQRILRKRYPQWCVGRERRIAKPGGHNSNHGESAFVENDRAADDFRIGTKGNAPEILAEDCDRRRAGFAVVWKKCAAREGLLFKEGEELRCYHKNVHDRRLAVAGQCELMKLAGRHFGENMILRAQVREVGIGDAGASDAFLRICSEHVDELFGARVWQRL